MATVMSRGEEVCYGFLSEGFKRLKPRTYPRKGDFLPETATRRFNADPVNVELGRQTTSGTTLSEWFDGPLDVALDEEVIGLGSYGYTLTVFSSEELPGDEDESEDDEAALIDSYAPKFAYGR